MAGCQPTGRVFLGTDGCRLAMDVRPLMCRLYPHDYSEGGLRGFCSGDDLACPAHLLAPGESLDAVIAAPRRRVEAWRALFYQELRSEYAARQG